MIWKVCVCVCVRVCVCVLLWLVGSLVVCMYVLQVSLLH